MNLQNKVSVLIPVYNREKLIEETVQSVLNQTYKNIEIIIVDNQSIDNTWEILQRVASQENRIKIFQNETNIGPVRNWKKCIDQARGMYGKILWSDDLIAPEFLEKTVPFLEDNSIGFVLTGTEIFRDDLNKKTFNYPEFDTGIYDSEQYIYGVLFEDIYPVSPGCALFRLEDLKRNLLIDIPNKVNSDFAMHAIGVDLMIFLLTANQYKKFAFVNAKLSFFRAHKGSISIQSNDGQLPLYYNLASAYFVETYRKDLIQKMNTIIWFNIKRFRKCSKSCSLVKVQNFYILNQNIRVNYIFLILNILRKILKKLGLI